MNYVAYALSVAVALYGVHFLRDKTLPPVNRENAEIIKCMINMRAINSKVACTMFLIAAAFFIAGMYCHA